jgi:hypothetical protein
MKTAPPRINHATMLPVAILAAALWALAAGAPFASATPDPIAGGATTISLKPAFVKKLKNGAVVVQKLSPTKLKGKRVTFTVSRGSLDPLTGLGIVNLSGGIRFKAGKRKALVKALVLDTTKKTLSASIAGKKLKLATVSAATATRNGFGVNISINSMRLTGQAARQLNRKLGFGSGGGAGAATSQAEAPPFKADQVFGSARAETQPQRVAILPGGNATLALSPSVGAKLTAVRVSSKPIAPTAFAAAGPPAAFALPIAGESIAPAATTGIVKTSGGVELSQSFKGGGGTTMTLGDIWVDLGTDTVTVELKVVSHGVNEEINLGSLGRRAFSGVSLTGAAVTSDPVAHTVTVQNATATLGTATTDRLNQVFVGPYEKETGEKAEPFAAGEQLGTFSFTAQTQ